MKMGKLFLAGFLSLLLVSCHEMFQDKVDMPLGDKSQTLLGMLVQPESLTKFPTPAQIYVSKGLYSGSIRISWNPVLGATSYLLERAVVEPDANGEYPIPSSSSFDVLEKSLYSAVYEDTIIPDPKYYNQEYKNRYYYRVSAQDINGKIEISDPTAWATTKTVIDEETGETKTVFDKPIADAYGVLFGAPSNVEAGKGEDSTGITVKWDKVDYAIYYKIYRGTDPNGLGMELLNTLTADQLSFRNDVLASDAGKEFYYKVRAQNASGLDSADSSLALGYSLQAGAPASIDTIDTSESRGAGTSSITVKWPASTWVASGDYEGWTLKYSLYRNSSQSTVYELIKNNIDQEKTSYTDTQNLVPGVEYYYYITSIVNPPVGTGLTPIKSAFSKTGKDSENPAIAYLLSSPKNIMVDKNGTNVNISFAQAVGYNNTQDASSKIKGSGPYTYKVYGSTSEDGAFTEDAGGALELDNEKGTGVLKGVALYPFYRLETRNKDDVASELSVVVAPVPDAPRNVVASKTAQIYTGDVPSWWKPNSVGVYPVKITWEAPADASGVGGYRILRSTSTDEDSFKVIEKELPVSPCEYIDVFEEAKIGTVYYYKVVSLNNLKTNKDGKNGNDPSIQFKAGNKAFDIDAAGWGAITTDYWFRQYNKTVMRSQKKLTLMHKPNDMDKLGSETINGDICGTLSYKSAIAGLGAEIVMHYEKYADFYISGNKNLGYYFYMTGNTDTTANMSANGNMSGTVVCTESMYPGEAYYNNLQIKGGAAGGGYYGVTTKDLKGNIIFQNNVDWKVGEEER